VTLSQLSKKERLGFIGLGGLGCLVARNLLIAGERVVGFDTSAEARTRFSESGGSLLRTPEELVRGCPLVFTCLPDSPTFVDVAETRLVPHAHAHQIFINVGIATPRETRRFARRFARKGASLLDAPVAGSMEMAECGRLRIFVGGELDAFERVRPLLEIIGDSEHITYCGSSGNGQIVKGVDQLAHNLVNAALLEAVSYGVNAGIRAEVLHETIGGSEGWRAFFSDLCEQVEKGNAKRIDINPQQYPLFLDEAREKQFTLPITRALHLFLRNVDKAACDANGGITPLWRELTNKLGVGAAMAAKRAARGTSSTPPTNA